MILGTRVLAALMSEPERLRDLVQARYILEPQLAALAALEATEEEIRRLITTVEHMEEKSDRTSLMALGHRFHLELSAMSHNQVLSGFTSLPPISSKVCVSWSH